MGAYERKVKQFVTEKDEEEHIKNQDQPTEKVTLRFFQCHNRPFKTTPATSRLTPWKQLELDTYFGVRAKKLNCTHSYLGF